MEMITVNRAELLGRIGHDPKIINAGNGRCARFTMATSEVYKDKNGELKEDTTWLNISAWDGKNVEDVTKLKKGMLVSVVGRIRSVKYTSSDGADKYFFEIVASSLSIEGVPQ